MDIFVKLIKGALIGSGFIVPGVSGGTLAMVFGVYERLISFLGDIRKNLKENLRYFVPIGLGAVLGVVLFSRLVSYMFRQVGPIISWFFVGAIVATLPSIWTKAGKKGRSKIDYSVLIISFLISLVLLRYGSSFFSEDFSPSFLTWVLCGVLIALGVLVPGLSSSNFIVYMGLYETMSSGFASLNLSIILPIALGGLLTVVLLIKFINWIYRTRYSKFFHFILGVVLSSTLMIIPDMGRTIEKPFVSLILFVLGLGLSGLMIGLEKGREESV